MRGAFFAFILFSWVLSSCQKEQGVDPEPEDDQPKVSVELDKVPYEKLSAYHFFDGDLKEQVPAEGVIDYAPASQLFTDYALKKRFLWLPPGSQMHYVADDTLLHIPVGAALIKTFYYEKMLPQSSAFILETRVMIHKPDGWLFAEYVWNEEQTDAFLINSGQNRSIEWIQDGEVMRTTYRLPSEVECQICHKDYERSIPIGLKPQNLNFVRNIAGNSVNQMFYLVSQGVLRSDLPTNMAATVDYTDESQDLTLRVRSFLDINCGHCHREGSHCDYRPLRLDFSETAIAKNLGICVEPDEFIDPALLYLVAPQRAERSMLHFRLNTEQENLRMPLLGRSIVHKEGVELVEAWIKQLTETCN